MADKQKPATAAKPINMHKQMAGYKKGGVVKKGAKACSTK